MHATVSSIKLPPSLDEISVDESSARFLRTMQREGRIDEEVKVVLGVYRGEGIVAVGPKRMFHVVILDGATFELDLPRIVTTVHPDTARPIPGAFIQGGYVKATEWEGPTFVLSGRSDTFGPFHGELCGQSTADAVREVLMKTVRAFK